MLETALTSAKTFLEEMQHKNISAWAITHSLVILGEINRIQAIDAIGEEDFDGFVGMCIEQYRRSDP